MIRKDNTIRERFYFRRRIIRRYFMLSKYTDIGGFVHKYICRIYECMGKKEQLPTGEYPLHVLMKRNRVSQLNAERQMHVKTVLYGKRVKTLVLNHPRHTFSDAKRVYVR